MQRAGKVGLRARDEADVAVLHAELYEDIAACYGLWRFGLAQRRAHGGGIAFKLRMRPADEGN
jgi:hypothetical protein